MEPEDDDLLPEYDFPEAERGKYYERYQQATKPVLLDPDAAQTFNDSESAFEAMARQGDDALLDGDELVPTRWDEEEWEWQ